MNQILNVTPYKSACISSIGVVDINDELRLTVSELQTFTHQPTPDELRIRAAALVHVVIMLYPTFTTWLIAPPVFFASYIEAELYKQPGISYQYHTE